MNNKRFPFWLRFIFFTTIFSIAFFLIIFVIEKNPSGDFRLLLIKVGLLASASSFIYNLLLESDPDPEIVD
jgi:hypothetical protein